MSLPPWIMEVVRCCQDAITTGDLSAAQAQVIIDEWIARWY